MNTAEALAIVELVEVDWPKFKLEDATKQLWAETIVRTEPHAVSADGYEAVRDLAAHQSWPPSLAEVILGIYGARLNRQATRGQLSPPAEADDAVSFAEFLHDNPDMAERVRAIADKQSDRKHRDNPIADGLAELLKQSGLRTRSKRDRATR